MHAHKRQGRGHRLRWRAGDGGQPVRRKRAGEQPGSHRKSTALALHGLEQRTHVRYFGASCNAAGAGDPACGRRRRISFPLAPRCHRPNAFPPVTAPSPLASRWLRGARAHSLQRALWPWRHLQVLLPGAQTCRKAAAGVPGAWAGWRPGGCRFHFPSTQSRVLVARVPHSVTGRRCSGLCSSAAAEPTSPPARRCCFRPPAGCSVVATATTMCHSCQGRPPHGRATW